MTAVSPGPSNPMYRALPPVRIESIDAWVTRSKTYTLPSTSVLTYTCALSGVTATSNAFRETGVPIGYSWCVDVRFPDTRSQAISLLRRMRSEERRVGKERG